MENKEKNSALEGISVEAKINDLKKRLEAKKNERNKAEANLEVQEKQLAEVTAQIIALGYEPDELPDVILKLETSILDNLKEAERILDEAEPVTTDEMLKRVGA